MRIDHKPVVIVVSQRKKNPPIFVVSTSNEQAIQIASYVLNIDFDIRPFYEIADNYETLCPVVRALWGLRPLRLASLFEMLVTAITEQQITLRLAYLIREKINAKFGDVIEGTPVFPDEKNLSKASLNSLLKCGLSHRKAEYIRDISRMVADRRLDLEELKQMNDDDVYSTLTKIRGIGPWTAEYFLVRGLGRADRVPVEDLGIREVVGMYLGSGQRVEASAVQELLKPFSPFRGLAAYYLLVHYRIFGNSTG